jgi:hypothetical protein
MFFQNFIQIVNKFLLCQKKKVNKFLLKHSKWEIQTSSKNHIQGGRYKQICFNLLAIISVFLFHNIYFKICCVANKMVVYMTDC